jgi:CheY-like chemotaxis protein
MAALPPDRPIAPVVPMAEQGQPFPTSAVPAIVSTGLDLRALLLQGICAPLSALRGRLQREATPELPAALAVLDDVMLMADAIADFVKAPGTHEPRADGFSPAELVENTVAMMRDVQGPSAPRLHWRVDPAVPTRMRGEVHHLSQILLILVDDAASLPGGGVATLDVARSAWAREALTFTVTHEPTGVGASHAVRDATARLRSIRLATLGRLVALIGGTLDLTGQARGVLLRMTVPATAEPTVADARRAGAEGPCNLVVIDEGGTGSQILTMFLTGAGHHVCRVGDADAAIFACQSSRPDVVLFDVAGTPEARRGALSSARAFRDVHSFIPLLVMAPALDDSEQAELTALGATGVLPKPFLPDALDLAIASARRMPAVPVEPQLAVDAAVDALDREARRALCEALGPASVERLTGQLLGEIDDMTRAGSDAARSPDASRIVELSSCAAMLGLSELARLCAAFDARRCGTADRLIAGRAVRTALRRTQDALASQRQAA